MSQGQIEGNYRGPIAPVRTELPGSLQEASGIDVGEIRAYKLGEKRWSYNQVEVVVCKPESQDHLQIKQAIHRGTVSAGDIEDAGVSYEILLNNDVKIMLEAFLAYDSPKAVDAPVPGTTVHEWTLVDRCACARSCSGPVLRAIQRFGKLGKRSWSGATPDFSDRTNHNMKDTRYMYLSFDEAGTHVGCKSFRLVLAAYDANRETLLGTAASPPVRVLANNDVPTGAAHLQVMLSVPTAWAGWALPPNEFMTPFTTQMTASDGYGGMASTPPTARPKSTRSAARTRRRTGDVTDDGDQDYNDSGFDASTPVMTSQQQRRYRTRRSSRIGAQNELASAAPISSGTPPMSPGTRSLLMDGSMGGMTPNSHHQRPFDAVATPQSAPNAPLHTEGSLTMWLDPSGAMHAHPHPSHNAPPLSPNALADHQARQMELAQAQAQLQAAHLEQQAQMMGLNADGSPHKRPKLAPDETHSPCGDPLPHSIDFEPQFPLLHNPHALPGLPYPYPHPYPSSGAVPGQPQRHNPHDFADLGTPSSANGIPGLLNSPRAGAEDPIAAFVELMMMQAQGGGAALGTHAPVLELPTTPREDHAGASSGFGAHIAPSMFGGDKLVGGGGAPAGAAAAAQGRSLSPILPLNLALPGTPPSLATPTPSALDEIFAGMAGHEAVNDDATSFPPTSAAAAKEQNGADAPAADLAVGAPEAHAMAVPAATAAV